MSKTVNIQIFDTDANLFLGKRIYSTSARQAVQVKLMTHCNEGSHEDLLTVALPDPGFALSSSDLRQCAQVSLSLGHPMPQWWDDASRDGGMGTGLSCICGQVALADLTACTKGCRKAADSPLPVNGIHKERGGPGVLQGGLRSFPLLEVTSFLFSKDVVFPRLGLFCAAGSTSAAHAEI